MNRITSSENVHSSVVKFTHEERQVKVNFAKDGVRKRRNRRMQVNFVTFIFVFVLVLGSKHFNFVFVDT